MRDDVAVVVVTYNAEPWLRRCLESVSGYPTVVVDHGSTDTSVETARGFQHVRVVEQENKGVGAGWNRGIAETTQAYVLLLNADAWALQDALAHVSHLHGFAIVSAVSFLCFALYPIRGPQPNVTDSRSAAYLCDQCQASRD